MSNNKTMKIPKGNLHLTFGVEPNKLSAFLKFSKGKATPQTGEIPTKEVIMPMLKPLNIGYVNALLNDDTFFFTTLLTDFDSFLYYAEDENFVSIKQTDITEITDLMCGIVWDDALVASSSKVSFTEDAFWTFICLVDLLRRRKLESLVLHLIDRSPIVKKDLEDAFELAQSSKDLRWLTPFAIDTFVFEGKPDFEKGIKVLSSMGFVEVSGTEISILSERLEWSVSVSESSSYLGIKSLFYGDKSLKVMGTLFLRVGAYLYVIEGTDRFSWVGISKQQFMTAIETLLAPGESNDLPLQKEEKTVKFCSYCGTALKVKSNFCKNCGKSVQ